MRQEAVEALLNREKVYKFKSQIKIMKGKTDKKIGTFGARNKRSSLKRKAAVAAGALMITGFAGFSPLHAEIPKAVLENPKYLSIFIKQRKDDYEHSVEKEPELAMFYLLNIVTVYITDEQRLTEIDQMFSKAFNNYEKEKLTTLYDLGFAAKEWADSLLMAKVDPESELYTKIREVANKWYNLSGDKYFEQYLKLKENGKIGFGVVKLTDILEKAKESYEKAGNEKGLRMCDEEIKRLKGE